MSHFPPPPPGSLLSYETAAPHDDYVASPPDARADLAAGQQTVMQQQDAMTAAAIHVALQRVRETVNEMETEEQQQSCQLGDVEFLTAPRCTNDKAFFALLGIALLSVTPIMSHAVMMVMCVGTVATYVFDLLGHRKATFGCMLATLGTAWIAFYLANFTDAFRSPTAMLIVLSVGAIFLLAALRGALQFQWLQAQAPFFAIVADAITNAALPIAAAPPLQAALIGLVGARWAPFAMSAVLCVMHYFFYRPMQSSFLEIATDVRQRAAEELVTLVGPVECAIASIFVMLFPSAVYYFLAMDMARMAAVHALNAIALGAAPLLYFFAMGPDTTLWFLRYVPAPRMFRAHDELEALLPTRNMLQVANRYRWALVFVFYSAMMHFAVERIVNSRFAYLFVGVTPPFNYVILVAIGYAISGLAACGALLLYMDVNPESGKRQTSLFLWLATLLLAVMVAIGIGIVSGMPGFFIPMSALSAACFVAYLVDRRATNNFVTFVCASTINLTWWMFKTFSFIRQDLQVIGDKWTITTSELAGAVLLCYLMGCACVGLSFTQNPGPLIVMLVMHGMKLTLIEHVLYSQREEGVYPALLVAATTAAGVVVAMRLLKNEVIPELAAAYISGLYGSKLAVYLVHINTAENEEHSFALETMVTEMFAMAAFAVLAMAELRYRRNEGLTLSQFSSVLVTSFIVLAFGMRDTVLRIFVEAIGFNQPSFVQLTAASGVACGALGFLLTKRYAKLKMENSNERAVTEYYPTMMRWSLHTTLAFAALLIVDPSLEAIITGEDTEDISDNPFYPPWWSRFSVFGVFVGLYLATRLPLHDIHVAVRGAIYTLGCVALSLAAAPLVIPASDWRVTLAMMVFLSMAAMTILACHHGNFDSDVCLILYLVSLVSLALAFVSLNYVSISVDEPHQASYAVEAHSVSRMGLLAVGCGVNTLIGIMLKCYLNGRPLIAGARKLTPNMGSQCALVLNYAVMIAFTTMAMLAYWTESDPCAVLCASAPLLLLLHNDGVLLTRLNKGPFRYLPTFAAICATVSWHVLMEAKDLHAAGRARRAVVVLVGLAALVPSHFSLGRFLFVPTKRKTTVARVSFFIVLDLVVLLMTPSTGVRWLAATGIVVNFGRLVISGSLSAFAAA